MSAGVGLSVELAVERVAAGELVAYPTETLWGLAADATSASALERLRAFKGRDADQPVSVLVSGAAALSGLGARVSPLAERLARELWPGPLTLVLPCGAALAGVAREDGAVGFRCSPHPLARALAAEAARRGVGPVTATSLNPSGQPPARTRADAERVCGEGPDAPVPLAGPDAGAAAASSVLDLTGESPVLLRAGALGHREIAAALREPLRELGSPA